MKKDKLLFIHTAQFGYHNNAFKYCYYLRDKYDITYLAFDTGRKRQYIQGVRTIYVPTVNIRGLNTPLLLFITLINILFFNGKIFVFYFKGCDWLKRLFSLKKMILDVRTLGVSKDLICNKIFDKRLYNTSQLYDYTTFISNGIKDKIDFNKNTYSILPLGADQISIDPKKRLGNLNLLYVGTLNNRDIEKTLYGFAKFCTLYPTITISYDIIGDFNTKEELSKFKSIRDNLKLSKKVKIHGRIPNTELQHFFDKCNIGVSFVPMTEYYDNQPVTKTFEYVMSGLYTIATATTENKKVVTKDNGILILDEVDSFCNALCYINDNKDIINSLDISSTLQDWRWDNIVMNKLVPILEEI